MSLKTQSKQQKKGSAVSVIHPLAIVNAASITSLVRMTLYHHSISVYHTKVERNEGVAALGEKARNAAAESPAGTAPYGAAARSDNHEQPRVTDGACSDSERKIP
jgi:hypothetical protein